MLAQKIGRNIIPVVEKYTELELILEYAEKVGVRPQIGMRVKLAARGGGRWQSSGGYRSKFGLTVTEILRGLEELKARGMDDCFKLLHFHLGSQITNIRIVKGALNEAARVYVELAQARRRAASIWTSAAASASTTTARRPTSSRASTTRSQEYANDVVYHLQTRLRRGRRAAPDDHLGERPRHRRLPQPARLQRARRARASATSRRPTTATDDMEQPLIDLHRDLPQPVARATRSRAITTRSRRSTWRMNLFTGGYLPLEQRWQAENLYWAICVKLQKLVQTMDDVPEDLQGLDESLSDTYFCNFSLFQSMPDSWAIKQLFPVMPIHRLERAADAARRARRHHLRLRRQDRSVHRPPRRQEDAAAAPVQRRAVLPRRVPGRRLSGNPRRPAQPVRRHPRRPRQPRRAPTTSSLDEVVKGDTVREVLDYVEFDVERAGQQVPRRRRSRGPRRPPRLRGDRAACCASTKTACTATPTSKSRRTERSRRPGSTPTQEPAGRVGTVRS